jgi:hypothetical protein
MIRIRSIVGAAALLAAVLATGPSLGQQPQNVVATLKDLEGNVLVSQGDAMVTGTLDQRLPAGTRVVTTAGAKVTISYDVGCDVRLKENERFTVNVGPCAALLAAVEPLGPAAGAIGGGAVAAAGATGTGLILPLAGVAALGAGAYALLRNNPTAVVVSPN